jgi:hypothetical protein
MLYSYIVEREIRKTFTNVNNHRWDEALEVVVPHVRHRVPGANALGGERLDKVALRRLVRALRPRPAHPAYYGDRRLGEGLAVADNRIRPVGWRRDAAQR